MANIEGRVSRVGRVVRDTLEEIVTQSGQQMIARRIVELQCGYKIKLIVCSDSVPSQCYAKSYIWSREALQWNSVYNIPHKEMKTKDSLAYFPNNTGKDIGQFWADLDYLMAMTREILF